MVFHAASFRDEFLFFYMATLDTIAIVSELNLLFLSFSFSSKKYLLPLFSAIFIYFFLVECVSLLFTFSTRFFL